MFQSQVKPFVASITLKGVRVHNLKSIDLEIPKGQSLTICGVSGSGKTSLAFNTLYAEGRRRFVETLSPRVRQHLEKLDRPDADSIENVPAAIAVRAHRGSPNQRLTVGITTELIFFLRQLFTCSKDIVCYQCDRHVHASHPGTVADKCAALPSDTRILVGFRHDFVRSEKIDEQINAIKAQGFLRAIVDSQVVRLDELRQSQVTNCRSIEIIVDRLTGGSAKRPRVMESLGIASKYGKTGYWLIIDAPTSYPFDVGQSETVQIEGKPWRKFNLSSELRCQRCGTIFPDPQEDLFNWNNEKSACPTCMGIGQVLLPSESLVVQDKRKSLSAGAITPLENKPFDSLRKQFLEAVRNQGIPSDIRYCELNADQVQLIWNGAGGIYDLFSEIIQKGTTAKKRAAEKWMHLSPCPTCHGFKLSAQGLSYRLNGMNIGQWSQLSASRLQSQIAVVPMPDSPGASLLSSLIDKITNRLEYLCKIGLDYLSLDRPMNTLSSGEGQRVALTVGLASTLVNALYVLDEPTLGLHASDCSIIIDSIDQLAGRGNTVVVVEHNETVIRESSRVIEIGPGAGEQGGKIVFDGPPDEMVLQKDSVTGDFLSGRRGYVHFERTIRPAKGQLQLVGATGNNLKSLDVVFPLGVLCVVTGVSGAGKTTLVANTLFAAIGNRIGQIVNPPLPHQQLIGAGQVDEVVLIDHSPVGKTPRSNPATYIKVFDEIRKVFAETIDAKTANLSPSHFSFNVEGGRCPKCEGDGQLSIDMQFMADVVVTCEACQGKRFRKEILSVRYRNRSIADVLEMTAREAISFFRGQIKIQAKLKSLVDVGLEYMTLGQGAHTLSAGESQRLKLAVYLSTSKRKKTLFILDEPTSGLHAADVVTLIDCFNAVLAVGHSIIIADHNLRLIASADHVIELGPGSADNGGELVFAGTPEELSRCPHAKTGQAINQVLLYQQ
jgi:excinuclease ABC subunit A